MTSWRRITGAAGVVAGAAAAGVGAVVAAERIAVNRLRGHAGATEPDGFGTLRGRPLTVPAGDGVSLHVEISGDEDAPVTIIFCHGYTLNQDCWHFQRRDLTAHRLVLWDQRDHGRSGRSPQGSADVRQLGMDLSAVIAATAPGGTPVVLVGHSMGGMTIMAFAEQHPELFGAKVVGAVLISTCARGLDGGSPWMPWLLRPMLSKALPGVLAGASAGRRALLVERTRRVSPDLALLSTRYLGFGDTDVGPEVVSFVEQMISGTPIGVVAQFGRALLECDMRGSLPVLGRVPVTVIVGGKDRLVAPRLGLELATGIPGAHLVWAPGGGHSLILEQPGLVNDAVSAVVARSCGEGGLEQESA